MKVNAAAATGLARGRADRRAATGVPDAGVHVVLTLQACGGTGPEGLSHCGGIQGKARGLTSSHARNRRRRRPAASSFPSLLRRC